MAASTVFFNKGFFPIQNIGILIVAITVFLKRGFHMIVVADAASILSSSSLLLVSLLLLPLSLRVPVFLLLLLSLLLIKKLRSCDHQKHINNT
jgi:hypothetical protein